MGCRVTRGLAFLEVDRIGDAETYFRCTASAVGPALVALQAFFLVSYTAQADARRFAPRVDLVALRDDARMARAATPPSFEVISEQRTNGASHRIGYLAACGKVEVPEPTTRFASRTAGSVLNMVAAAIARYATPRGGGGRDAEVLARKGCFHDAFVMYAFREATRGRTLSPRWSSSVEWNLRAELRARFVDEARPRVNVANVELVRRETCCAKSIKVLPR